jgi:multidrug efflux pump subunit AcrA (membrane-fusion protein)
VVPTLNPGTRTFSVIVEIDNTANKLRAGMFAEVRVGAARTAASAVATARPKAKPVAKGPGK